MRLQQAAAAAAAAGRRARAAPQPVAMAAGAGRRGAAGAPVAAVRLPSRRSPPRGAAAVDPDDDVVDDKTVDADGVDLQALARNAAMKAEREAIDQALARFRWNRRKAAALPEGQLQDAAQQDEGVRHLRAGRRAVLEGSLVEVGLERLLHHSPGVLARAGASHPDRPQEQVPMADITNLRDAFLDEIRDVYHAEKQLLKALPKLAKAATDAELRGALENHLAETENQVSRLEQVFELVGEKPETKTCAGMAGIIEEGSDVLGEERRPGPRRADHRLGAAGRALRDRRLRHRRRVGREPRLHRRGGAAARNAG